MLPANQIQQPQHSHQHRQPQLLKWLQEQQRPGRLRGIMERERNKQFIRQARERGYLQSPSDAAIIKACQESNQDVSSLDEVLLVRLCGVHLRDVGAVGQCFNLMVCNLAGNYIKSFEALAPCRRLIKLDLHGNQINQLPGEKFWAGMTQLKIVHLHDNSISRLDYLQSVGAASNLHVLTLYDTPISLKMTYRHHVVNSVWSLKALDHHVISDEEIIEDAVFGGHFSMLHAAFYIDSRVPSKKDASIGEELSHVREVLQRVSHIQARNSPVLIIQRFIRGWLARRRFKVMARTKVWATVTIQRYWRTYKGYEWNPQQEEIKGQGGVAPPTTAAPEAVTARKISVTPPQMTSTAPRPREVPPDPAVVSGSVTEASGSRMDYDTYLRNRRPGSTCRSPSQASAAMGARDEGQRQGSAEAQHTRLAEEKESLMTPTTAATTVQRRANFVVRMRQLQSDLHLNADEEARLEALLREGVRPGLGRSMGQDFKKPSRPKETKKKRKKKKSVGELLGTLSDSELLRDRSSDDFSEEDCDECEVSAVKFRLSGLTPVVNRLDPTQELLLSRREAGNDVRMGLAAYYTKKAASAGPPRKHSQPKKPMNADQKLFARTQGTMGTSCLKAVLQAYRDREHSDKQGAKRDKVSAMREQREEGKLRAKSFLEEKRLKAMQQRDREIVEISQEYDKQAGKEIEEQERRREIRIRDVEIAARVRRENTFSQDFNSQHTSISNALLRHDWQARSDKLALTRKDFVEGEHKHEMGQRELVRRYVEHRNLMRQAKVAVEKAATDARVVHESNDRLMEARINVSRQKDKAQRIQAFYPLPKCATNPVLPPVRREGKPDRWNTLISMYEGRVGNHPAMAGTL